MLADLLAKLELRTNERNTAMQDAAAATSRIKVLGRRMGYGEGNTLGSPGAADGSGLGCIDGQRSRIKVLGRRTEKGGDRGWVGRSAGSWGS